MQVSFELKDDSYTIIQGIDDLDAAGVQALLAAHKVHVREYEIDGTLGRVIRGTIVHTVFEFTNGVPELHVTLKD